MSKDEKVKIKKYGCRKVKTEREMKKEKKKKN